MAGMLAQKVSPMRVMATIKTEAFWWPSRRFGQQGGGGPCSGLFGVSQQLGYPAEAVDLMG